MEVRMIAAMTPDRVIGIDNSLPWHIPRDLKRFKALTLGKSVLLGRKTYESIGGPLPHRTNIVLSQDPSFVAPGCLVANTIEDVMKITRFDQMLMVAGGSTIYELFMPKADYIDLTIVDTKVEGDSYFPQYAKDEWREIWREDHFESQDEPFNYSFITLERIKKP